MKIPTGLDRVLFGTNPIAGVDHFSTVRARERVLHLNLDRAQEVTLRALESGATGISLDLNGASESLIGGVRASELRRPVGLYPILPDSDIVPTVLNKGAIAAISAIRASAGVSGAAEALLGGITTALTSDPASTLKAYLRVTMSRLRRWQNDVISLKGVVLHELMTDAMLGLDARELLETFVREVLRTPTIRPGFVTRNFSRFARWISQLGVPPDKVIIFTPLNPIGFQMTPDRLSSEGAIREFGGFNVYAISILAGGRLTLEEGLSYLKTLPEVTGVVLGTASTAHAQESFPKLAQFFERAA